VTGASNLTHFAINNVPREGKKSCALQWADFDFYRFVAAGYYLSSDPSKIDVNSIGHRVANNLIFLLRLTGKRDAIVPKYGQAGTAAIRSLKWE